jgi:hypothetical protein
MRYSRRGYFAAGMLATLLPVAAAAPQASELYVYPLKKQSSEQQDKDRYECHRWAAQQTGFDPSRPTQINANAVDAQSHQPSQPHVLRGAGRAPR